jgi:hypothetical protein
MNRGTAYAVSKHIFYEASMLIRTTKLLVQRPAGGFWQGVSQAEYGTLQSALVESFATHARNLVYFLYATTDMAQKDDLLAVHYVEPSVWEPVRSSLGNLWTEVSSRANKEIHHLTKTRLDREAVKTWEVLRIAKQADQAFRKFVGLLPGNAAMPQPLAIYIQDSAELQRDFGLLTTDASKSGSASSGLAVSPPLVPVRSLDGSFGTTAPPNQFIAVDASHGPTSGDTAASGLLGHKTDCRTISPHASTATPKGG